MEEDNEVFQEFLHSIEEESGDEDRNSSEEGQVEVVVGAE